MKNKNGFAEWSTLIMLITYVLLHIPFFFALKFALERAMW